MKPLLPPELVLGTSLLLASMLALPAQTPVASPSAATVTFGPPVPGPASSRDPEPVRSAPIWVVPPNPAPQIAPPARPPLALVVPGKNLDRGYVERATPKVTVWRSGSNVPQNPSRSSKHGFQAMIAGSEPVTIVLRFHPLLAGQTVSVRTGNGVVLQPATRQLQIGPTGEAALLATVEAGKREATIGFAINGIDTFLHLTRFSENFVAKREAESAKGLQ